MSTFPDYYYIQSAVIPYRGNADTLEILLIRSRRDKRWVVPKGIVEQDMTPAASAAKEAMEEAGIEGKIASKPLGDYEYEKWDGVCQVKVYAMAVTIVHKRWLEDFRRREWVSAKTAAERVQEPVLKAMIRGLAETLETKG